MLKVFCPPHTALISSLHQLPCGKEHLTSITKHRWISISSQISNPEVKLTESVRVPNAKEMHLGKHVFPSFALDFVFLDRIQESVSLFGNQGEVSQNTMAVVTSPVSLSIDAFIAIPKAFVL
ncbi:hypothetical protein D5086_021976 [Populus alba]|uniref:Uncharacterized protein n=1 Tax=Populus alba TaxID=43335 RepID=A0ACC4BFE4_POPAL